MGNLKAMNIYMNRVTEEMFGSFDVGTKPSRQEPERFYHGFVLGLLEELANQYVIIFNRESGFGSQMVALQAMGQAATASSLSLRCRMMRKKSCRIP